MIDQATTPRILPPARSVVAHIRVISASFARHRDIQRILAAHGRCREDGARLRAEFGCRVDDVLRRGV